MSAAGKPARAELRCTPAGRPRGRFPRLQYVHTFRRKGAEYSYFRRPGYPHVRLPGLRGTTEFMDAYQAALRGVPPAIGKGRVAEGSLDALCVAFYGSAGFKKLKPITQGTYRNRIEKLRSRPLYPGAAVCCGDLPVAKLDADAVGKLIAAKEGTPAAANGLRIVLRKLMRFAVARKWVKADPTAGIERVEHKATNFHSWTEEEIAAYAAKHPPGTKARLALELLTGTGQRRGDIVALGPHNLAGGRLRLKQGKTGTPVSIPVHPHLARELAHLPADQATFLATEYGKPFTVGGFYNRFAAWAKAAGLPAGCSPHGLRRATGRRLAEAGATPHQIMSILGLRTLTEAQRYTNAADAERMADAGMELLAGAARDRTG